MRKLILLTLLLSGCSLIPSKWDINQARTITDMSYEAVQIDCGKDPTDSLNAISHDLAWLHIYNTYKGTSDLESMTSVVQKTVKEFQTNVASKKSNVIYCQLKKALIIQQTDIIGHTFQGSLP